MKKNATVRLFFLFLLIASTFLSAGCCSLNTLRPLDKAKQLANRQDYGSLAAIDAGCDESCEGCNQLHLLKGDACYRLAKNNQEPQKHYACAAAELAEGIRLTKQWQTETFNLNRTQTYTNLSESLRNWRDLSKGSEADAINDRLLKTAQQFMSVEPGNGCAIYYFNNAEYAQQRACLLHPENCPSLCGKLQGLLQSLADGIAQSGTSCGPNLKELAVEIGRAREIAHCQ